MQKIEEWKKHYNASSEALQKARDNQRKRTSALFELVSHKLSNSTEERETDFSDEKRNNLVSAIAEGMAGMILGGLLSITEATHAMLFSVSENDDMYATFDNNNFSFIYAYLKSLDGAVLEEIKKIAKEINLVENLEELARIIAESNLTDKNPKAFDEVFKLLRE